MALFDLLTAGAIHLANRIVMAPADPRARDPRPCPDAAHGHLLCAARQRRLIVSEASPISLQGAGWPWSPGFWTDEQVAAWQPVTQGVHEAGGQDRRPALA